MNPNQLFTLTRHLPPQVEEVPAIGQLHRNVLHGSMQQQQQQLQECIAEWSVLAYPQLARGRSHASSHRQRASHLLHSPRRRSG